MVGDDYVVEFVLVCYLFLVCFNVGEIGVGDEDCSEVEDYCDGYDDEILFFYEVFLLIFGIMIYLMMVNVVELSLVM